MAKSIFVKDTSALRDYFIIDSTIIFLEFPKRLIRLGHPFVLDLFQATCSGNVERCEN